MVYEDEIDKTLLPLTRSRKKKPHTPSNDTPPKGRPRVMTATETVQIRNLQAKINVLAGDPCPANVVGVICGYLEADLYNLVPSDVVLRGKAFLEMLYKKYDPSVLQMFGFTGNSGMELSGDKPPKTLSTPQKQIDGHNETKT